MYNLVHVRFRIGIFPYKHIYLCPSLSFQFHLSELPLGFLAFRRFLLIMYTVFYTNSMMWVNGQLFQALRFRVCTVSIFLVKYVATVLARGDNCSNGVKDVDVLSTTLRASFLILIIDVTFLSMPLNSVWAIQKWAHYGTSEGTARTYPDLAIKIIPVIFRNYNSYKNATRKSNRIDISHWYIKKLSRKMSWN